MKAILSKTVLSILIFLLIAIFTNQFSFADDIPKVDWNNPATINPFEENIGDFLDIDINAYRLKGDLAYRSGNYEEAARYFLLLARYNYRDAVSIYNLASCCALLGKEQLAAKYLDYAVKAGFEDIEHLKRDPDFDKVRGKAYFDSAFVTVEKYIKQRWAQLGQVIYVNGSALFMGRIKLPENYDPEKTYPLLIGLHGYGSSPDEFITMWERFDSPEFIYVAPQGQYPLLGDNRIGYSWSLGIPAEENRPDGGLMLAEEFITDMIGGLSQRFKIGNVYLMGFSQGARMAYLTGINHPEQFAGIFCFGGRLPIKMFTEEAIENAAGKLRVFISHGKNELGDSYNQAIVAREALKSYGYDVTFRAHDGAHEPPPPLIMYEFHNWMKEK